MSENIERATGEQVDILFEGKKCIHARHCVLSRPDVFVPNVAGEWIHPDAATAEEVVALAHACPSGAIRYERKDGGPQEAPPRVNVLRVRENGPLAVHADVTVEAGEGPVRLTRATLCRCGASANKPYCDGSHAAAGFTATGEPPVGEVGTLPARNGEVVVRATKNGPLHARGNLELCAGTGHTIAKVDDAWLCRCGQSKNKPYCDGMHNRVKFQAPGV